MTRARAVFSESIVETETFLELPYSVQALYFHLSFECNSVGALNHFSRTVRSFGIPLEDAEILFDLGYLLRVDDVVFITHWRVHNKADKLLYQKRPKDFDPLLEQIVSNIEEIDSKPYSFQDKNTLDTANRIDSSYKVIKSNSKQTKSRPQVNQQSTNENEIEYGRVAQQPDKVISGTEEENTYKPIQCPDCHREATEYEQLGISYIDCRHCGRLFQVEDTGEIISI